MAAVRRPASSRKTDATAAWVVVRLPATLLRMIDDGPDLNGARPLLGQARASSRSLTSMSAKPPITSFDSMNGPSVTTIFPFFRDTVVAVLGPCSSSPPTTLPALVYFSNHWPDFS